MRELAPLEQIDDDAIVRGFFDASLQAFLVLDADGVVVECNSAAITLMGHAGLGIGEAFDQLVDAADRVQVTHALAQAVGAGICEIEASIHAVAGHPAVPVTVSAAGFVSAGRALSGLVVIDRTATVQAGWQLEAREEQYRMVFEHSPVALREEDFSQVGLWMDDLRERGIEDLAHYLDAHPGELRRAIRLIETRRVNPALVELTGARDEAEVLSIGFADIEFTDDVLGNFRDQLIILWNGGTTHESEFEGRNHKGDPFFCRMHWAVQVVDGRPNLSRVIAGIVDITAVRVAHQYLEGLIEERDRFVAGVSHELRTPLAAIYGLSHELSERWEDFTEADVRSLNELMASQSAVLTALVEDLLLAAKLEMGEIPIATEQVGLMEIARGAIDDVARSDTPLGEVPLVGDPTVCLADAARARQIVRNLLTNAAKYGGDNVRIEVAEGATAIMRVCDDGAGIPPEHRAGVFEPYHRGAAPTAIGSLGLGLSISRQLARAMGGDLEYRHIEGESVFTLTLPLPE